MTQEHAPAASRRDLLSAVARVGKIAEAHASESERLRTLHPAVVDALAGSGLVAFAAPTEVGGGAADALTQLEVFEAMARIDGSAGWSLMIAALHASMAGACLDARAIDGVFAGNAVPMIAGLLQPSGVATRMDGGFVVRGRWAFGSGIRHARFVVASAFVDRLPTADGPPPELVMVIVPIDRVVIEDTWCVAGLRGTGSEHYRLDGVFVEEAFSFSFPCAPARRGSALHRLPVIALLTPGHAGFVLGVARGALDAVVACAASRVRPWTRQRLVDQPTFHDGLGRAYAKLEAARAWAVEACRSLEAIAARDATPTREEWMSLRSVVTHATEVSIEVARFAFHAGGGAALYDDSPLQRRLRDLLAAGQHVAATDEAHAFAGRGLLGLDLDQSPLLLPRAIASNA